MPTASRTVRRRSAPAATAPVPAPPTTIEAARGPVPPTSAANEAEDDFEVFVEREFASLGGGDGPMVTLRLPDDNEGRLAELELGWGTGRDHELHITRANPSAPEARLAVGRLGPLAVAFRVGDVAGLRALAAALMRIADAADADCAHRGGGAATPPAIQPAPAATSGAPARGTV